MTYRIYVDYLKGYKCLGSHNAKRTIMILDELVSDKRFKTFLIIGEDKENNEDIPMFSFNGFNYDEYNDFREKLIVDNNVKRYIK